MHLNTDYRYRTQAPVLPLLADYARRIVGDNRRMGVAFDIAAVKAAMERQGATQEAVARAAGLTHKSALAKIFAGARQVKVQEASRIYDYLRLAPEDSYGVRSVPLIGLAAAGNWREAIEIPGRRVVLPQHIAGARSFAVEVAGDSMNKLVEDGGWVVIDPEDKILKAGKCYLIQNADHEVTLKQYEASPARFEPMSDNDEHRSFLVSECDFIVLGRAVWKGERL